jgi:hypothetical protein
LTYCEAAPDNGYLRHSWRMRLFNDAWAMIRPMWWFRLFLPQAKKHRIMELIFCYYSERSELFKSPYGLRKPGLAPQMESRLWLQRIS